MRRRISRAQQTKNWCVGFSFPPPAYAGIHPTLYLFGFRANALNSHFSSYLPGFDPGSFLEISEASGGFRGPSGGLQNSLADPNMITFLPPRYSGRTAPTMLTPGPIELPNSWHRACKTQGHSTKNFLPRALALQRDGMLPDWQVQAISTHRGDKKKGCTLEPTSYISTCRNSVADGEQLVVHVSGADHGGPTARPIATFFS